MKKLLKKLLVMTFSLFAAVTLTACGSSSDSLDAFELLELSHEAQAEALEAGNLSMTMNMDVDVSMDMDGMAMTMPMTMRMEIESEERMSMEMSMSFMGQEMNTTMFLRDGYEYSEAPDPFTGQLERTRTEVDMDGTAEIAETFGIDLSDASEDWFEESSAETTDEGYRLEFVLNMEGLVALLDDLDMGELLGDDEIGDLFNFDHVDSDEDDEDESISTMIMYLDEDYMLISSIMEFTLSMTVEEAGISMDMTMDMTITMNIEDVTIDFPDWLDEVGAPVNFEDSALLGYWENGSGDVFLWVFNRADSVEFLADGTLIITEDGSRTTVEWEPTEPGAFIADGDDFTYSIHGDVLTIADRANDEWSFYREGTAPISDDDEDDDDEDNGDTSGSSASDFDASDWRAFLAEYEALVVRVNENPTDLTLFDDLMEWSDRADEIMESLDLDDMLEFLDELLRIMEMIEI